MRRTWVDCPSRGSLSPRRSAGLWGSSRPRRGPRCRRWRSDPAHPVTPSQQHRKQRSASSRRLAGRDNSTRVLPEAPERCEGEPNDMEDVVGHNPDPQDDPQCCPLCGVRVQMPSLPYCPERETVALFGLPAPHPRCCRRWRKCRRYPCSGRSQPPPARSGCRPASGLAGGSPRRHPHARCRCCSRVQTEPHQNHSRVSHKTPTTTSGLRPQPSNRSHSSRHPAHLKLKACPAQRVLSAGPAAPPACTCTGLDGLVLSLTTCVALAPVWGLAAGAAREEAGREAATEAAVAAAAAVEAVGVNLAASK